MVFIKVRLGKGYGDYRGGIRQGLWWLYKWGKTRRVVFIKVRLGKGYGDYIGGVRHEEWCL